ncbi:uncharacterized protein At4g06598-like [Impatiens glandulifera]|uniref:uncharacterized protein At4g06598-like n=1 Tax=Impatiens glandulifera TaxID=253017 RepID=UPI001FB0ACC5|nr:uncharacterized protein At4g06598-like [Impatiens glandulifera]
MQHYRASSESYMEEQPSWLDELLDEPEIPVQRNCHRRSSSDSFAYTAYNYGPCKDYSSQDIYKSGVGSQDFDQYNAMQGYRPWDSPVNSIAPNPSTFLPVKDMVSSTVYEKKHDTVENGPLVKTSSETDLKRTKQQFAQRSRVRKLQYIAELEMSVQALQLEGFGVCSELEFLGQQNLILSLENKALMQRLENISQEHVIKCLEHEVLERELRRLRCLYQQQQQQQLHQSRRPSPRHRRTSSNNDLNMNTNTQYNQKDANSIGNPIIGPFHM